MADVLLPGPQPSIPFHQLHPPVKLSDRRANNLTNLSARWRSWRPRADGSTLIAGVTAGQVRHNSSLDNREAQRAIDVFVDNKRLAPNDLGVRLDRVLNFKQHLEEVAGNVTSRASLIRRLAGTTWGASAKTLRSFKQAQVFPAAEYCAPVWSRSPHEIRKRNQRCENIAPS